MPYYSLKKRCLALLMDQHIAALVVVVQTNECLYHGLAFDQINTLTKTGGELCSWKNMNDTVTTPINDAVNHLFENIVINGKA